MGGGGGGANHPCQIRGPTFLQKKFIPAHCLICLHMTKLRMVEFSRLHCRMAKLDQ